MDTTTDRSALEQKLIPELQRIAQDMGIEGTQRLRKAGLIDAIVAGGNGSPAKAGAGATAEATGRPRPRAATTEESSGGAASGAAAEASSDRHGARARRHAAEGRSQRTKTGRATGADDGVATTEVAATRP